MEFLEAISKEQEDFDLSFAWVFYLPIAIIVFIFGFPIFYSKDKKKK